MNNERKRSVSLVPQGFDLNNLDNPVNLLLNWNAISDNRIRGTYLHKLIHILKSIPTISDIENRIPDGNQITKKKKFITGQTNLSVDNDPIITIAIHNSFDNSLQQEVEVLGYQNLLDLKNCIYCKHNIGDIRNNDCFFYIEGLFYINKNEKTENIEKTINEIRCLLNSDDNNPNDIDIINNIDVNEIIVSNGVNNNNNNKIRRIH